MKNKKFEIQYLSGSQIRTYLNCPFAYKKLFSDFHKILNIEGNKYLDLITDEFTQFGKYIHKVLQLFVETKKDIFVIAKQQMVSHNIELEQFMLAKQVLNTYLSRGYDKYKTIATEKKFEIILGNGLALRGAIDRIIEIDENTIEIIDYKSGKKFFSNNYVNSDIQLIIYWLATKELFPKYKNIIVTLDPLQYDPISKDCSEFNEVNILDWLEPIYEQITKGKEFLPKYNYTCGYCDIYNICLLMQQLDKLKINPTIKDDEKNMEKYADEFIQDTNISKILENKIDNLKEFFRKKAELQNTDCLKYNWGSISVKNNRVSAFKKNKNKT